MSTESTSENTEGGDTTTPASPPPAADRPVVDGTRKTSEELRAELELLLEEDRQRAAEQPDPAGETVGQLASRVGVPRSGTETAGADAVARIRDSRNGAVARVQHQVERARTTVPEKASTVAHTLQERAVSLRTSVPERASSLRHTAQEAASTVRDTAQERPRVLAAVAAALVLILLARRLSTRR